MDHQRAERLAERWGTPLYVYDADCLRARCRELTRAIDLPGIEWLYAVKANGNPRLLELIAAEGLGADAVSSWELRLALACGFAKERASYTPNNASPEELAEGAASGADVVVDSLSQLRQLAEIGTDSEVGIRINTGHGAGHHKHVVTGGADSKFGLEPDEIPAARALAKDAGLRLVALHQHIGSGILDPQPLLDAVEALATLAPRLPELEILDFGGGLGIPYRPGERALDLAAFGAAVRPRLLELRSVHGEALRFRFEPGRFVVAESGTLLVRVTSVKDGGARFTVGTDSGFNHLLRPALYDSYHPIRNLSRSGAAVVETRVAGNICESGDLFADARPLPRCEPGDLLAIDCVGAYGFSMASNYNLRPRPAELLVDGDTERLIRRRESFEDLLAQIEE